MGQYASAEGMEKPRRQAVGRMIRRGEGGVDGWSGPLWSLEVDAPRTTQRKHDDTARL